MFSGQGRRAFAPLLYHLLATICAEGGQICYNGPTTGPGGEKGWEKMDAKLQDLFEYLNEGVSPFHAVAGTAGGWKRPALKSWKRGGSGPFSRGAGIT